MPLDHSRIQVLSFDLDDTLWDGSAVILHAEQAMLNWMQQHTPDILNTYSKEQLREHKFQFIKRNPQLMNRISEARQAYLSELFSQFKYADHQQKAADCFQTFYNARQQVTLFDGVTEALEKLKQHYRLIAITNGNADIALTGLADYFEFSLNAEDFEQPKPHSDIFHAALKQANITASECLHVGDHPEHDMLGAHKMGMATCWLKDGKRQWNQDFSAHLDIAHVSELVPILLK